jgi:hypothetical protein
VPRKDSELTPSQNAMLKHFAHLECIKGQEACWRDFCKFQVGGKDYQLKKGTIRNNFLRLKRLGKIELAFRDVDAYYTLAGLNTQKKSAMTLDHARVGKRDLAALIERMAFDAPAAHDIHLRFKVDSCWKTLGELATVVSATTKARMETEASAVDNAVTTPTGAGEDTLSIRAVSKDLVLPVMPLGSGIHGLVTVHKNDTVTVILSCSGSPITFDIGGLVRLTSSLARVEERLRSLIDIAQQRALLSVEAANPAAWPHQQQPQMKLATMARSPGRKSFLVPECGSWTVTMWHVGFDSLERYAGEKFEVAWEDYSGELIRAYSKQMIADETCTKGKKAKKKRTIRIERQEYPKDRLRDAVEEKMSSLLRPKMGAPARESS